MSYMAWGVSDDLSHVACQLKCLQGLRGGSGQIRASFYLCGLPCPISGPPVDHGKNVGACKQDRYRPLSSLPGFSRRGRGDFATSRLLLTFLAGGDGVFFATLEFDTWYG